MEHLILVDENDTAIGTCEKMEAHEKALLHRAFSVFLFNEKGETLLQKRWQGKYHSGGLWTNTCCGHPCPEEDTRDAAMRRTGEELGNTCALEESFTFMYKAPFENGLMEHEYVHVYKGHFEGPFTPHPEEVEGLKWVTLDWLKEDITQTPQNYTKWFQLYCADQWEKVLRMVSQ